MTPARRIAETAVDFARAYDACGPDRARFLACIAAVETRRNKKLGAHGEKGSYQFTRSTWQSLTSLPFSAADDDMHADQVAAFYFNKLRYGLLSRGLDVTVRNLAVAWNGGVNSVLLHKWANADVRDYGVRVEALYRDREFKP